MRNALAAIVGLMACSQSTSHATEARSEATVSRDFAYVASDVESEFLDGQLALGGGLIMVSDFINERYGARGSVEYRGERVSAGLDASFGPRQVGRGWASLDPHAELRFSFGRWILRGQGGVVLRRIDAAIRRSPVAVDQLQLHFDFDASFDDCWSVGVYTLYSFYDPDPALPSLRGLDLGLAVTLAGRPERWAVGGRIGARVISWLHVELGVAGAAYADGSGNALVPHVALRGGPWRGLTIGTSLDVAINVTDESPEQVREIVGVEIGYER